MNTLASPSLIAKRAVRRFYNALGLTQGINMEYKDEFAAGGATAKSVTVNVKKPVRFRVSEGEALNLQDVNESTTPFTIQFRDHVDFQFSSAELALGIAKFDEDYIKPAAEALAAKFNRRAAMLYKKCANYVGTPGTTPTTSITFSHARTALSKAGCPDENLRRMVIDSNMHAYAVDALKGLLSPVNEISEQYRRGVMGKALGFTWVEDNNLVAHTTGTFTGTGVINGANQTGTSIVTDGWTAGDYLNEGDVVEFAGSYAVDPVTFESTGVLAKHAVAAKCTADGAGNMTIPLSGDGLITSGSTQTVTASPADNAAVTIFGHATSYSNKVAIQGMAFHPKALTAAFVDLPLPRGADMAARVSDDQLGISMRLWRDGDIKSDQFPTRLDIFYGVEVLRPGWVCRING